MKKWLAGLASAALLVSVWQVLVVLTGWPKFILPGPALVVETIWKSRALLSEHALYTITEVLVGLALGAVLGGLSAIGVNDSTVGPIPLLGKTGETVCFIPRCRGILRAARLAAEREL